MILLTPAELHALTGYSRGADQRRWLMKHGWTYVIGADGAPRVSRAHAERQLGGSLEQPRRPQLRLGPVHTGKAAD
jgi:hypothetical protein